MVALLQVEQVFASWSLSGDCFASTEERVIVSLSLVDLVASVKPLSSNSLLLVRFSRLLRLWCDQVFFTAMKLYAITFLLSFIFSNVI